MNTASNPKRIQILLTAKDLFYKFGFKRVTIEEISKEAGVSKMTFYKFFPNKIELAKNVLTDVFDDALSKIRRLHEEHESPDKTLKKILQLKAEGTKDISEEFIKDLYAQPEGELKSYMEEKTRWIYTEIMNVYEKGKEDGWVRKDLNIPFFMAFSRSVIDSFSKDEVLHHFDSLQEMIMEIANIFIYGISPHE